MEIGLIYSSKDPRHTKTRDFVRQFVRDRGILARIIESEQPVTIPTLTIDGCQVVGPPARAGARAQQESRFPTLDEIGKALEQSFWCL